MRHLRRLTPEGQHCFFGYYDKTPWNQSENKLLFTQVDVWGRMPRAGEKAAIGYVCLESMTPRLFDQTMAWNFQQGAMLQWVKDDVCLYNIFESGMFRAKLYSLAVDDSDFFDLPVYALANNKAGYMSVDFSRLNHYRSGYGYLGKVFEKDDVAITYVDLESKKKHVVVRFSDFISEGYIQPADDYWVDHILFSPDDQHIAFLLRMLTEDGGVYSRVFCCRINGSELRCLLDTGMASHAAWFDNNHFTIWGRQGSFVKSVQKSSLIKYVSPLIKLVRKVGISSNLRRSLYGDAFLNINIHDAASTTFANTIPANEGGGHYTFDSSRQWMLNDTLGRSDGLRTLMLYDLKVDARHDLGELYTPPEMDHTSYRCDLHPRWSPLNREICIDSVHEGFRAIYVLSVDHLIKRA